MKTGQIFWIERCTIKDIWRLEFLAIKYHSTRAELGVRDLVGLRKHIAPSKCARRCRNAHYSFERSVELQQVVRQQGGEQALYRQALERLRFNQPSVDDWRLLSTRTYLTGIITFDDAIRIYLTNAQVLDTT